MAVYTKGLSELYNELNINPETGLDEIEADKRLKENGKNELPKISRGFFKIYFAPLFNLLIVIYLVGALLIYILSRIGGETELSDVYLTLGIVAVNMFIAIIQQFRASKKLKALKQLIAPTTTVIRNGQKKQILTKNLVVGDILSLEQGNKIPADARIISYHNLEVNESSLTGESEPQKKNNSVLTSEDIPISERVNMLFYGTFITMGSVQAVVVSTGANTEIGKISKGLKESSTTDIPIQKKMNNFGKWLGLLVMLFWIAVLILRWVITGDVELVQSLTAAMDIMPINIPLLTTVVMLTGVLAMAKRGVIIKDLTSVDSLGRISIVCTDKTGTLTQNKMVVRYICTYNKLFKVTGTGYSPEGDFLIKNNNEFTKIDSIDNYLPLKLLLVAGYLNSNATLTKNLIKIEKKKQEVWDVIGSPTEGALVAAYLKVMPEITKEHYENIIEFPFDSNLKRMSKAIQYKQDPRIFTYTKGASEVVIPICSKIFVDKGVVEYSDDLKSNFMQQIKYFEEQGFRVLSLAYKQLPTMPDESEQSRLICESDLIYLGFVTIADPPRDGVKESVIECNNAGVQVVMITGDSISTAKAIASEISIIKDPSESAILGKDIEKVNSSEQFNNIRVFARVTPKHKEEIIKQYQSQNKIVAMTGDGVNDALALNMADCGIAMGIQGTDVAKESADMIISDDSFNSIVKGIEEGRGIFARIRAVIFFFIVTNLFEGLVQFILTIFFGLPYFLTGVFMKQWMLLAVTAHMFPGLILTFDTLDKDVMKQKPRDNEEIITRKTFKLMTQFGVLLAISMLLVYFLVFKGIVPIFTENIEFGAQNNEFLYSDYYDLLYYFPDGLIPANPNWLEFTEICTRLGLPANIDTLRLFGKTLTMLMATLFFCESAIALQIRRPNKSLFKSLKEDRNILALLTIGFIFLCFFALIYIPRAQTAINQYLNFNFMFMHLNWIDWIVTFLCASICIFGFELVKYWYRRKGISL